ncbi:60s ribosome biogenesis protein mak11 [Tieghemiomyces parasiticus]|uniref:60s ribosome biogenesis protein mak11 n=1 Tax=Tieghemiomyces parasiticus TaxID=78921 RepID=A0A9W8ABR5_9FUNG|nr:60s ribosome biogenesis protein mak11 [Tieghemiomyces parasiticus]
MSPRKKQKVSESSKAVVNGEGSKTLAKADNGLFVASAGTYERILYGVKGEWATTDTPAKVDSKETLPQLRMELIFSFPAHIGVIKAVAAGDRFLASGGVDEQIKLFDLGKRYEIGTLMEHQGTITTIEFYGKSHMITGGEDGLIIVWRTKDWESLVAMKGHKGRVNDIAVHPSGRLALSVSSDRTIRVWNLLTGRKASAYKIGREGLVIKWLADAKRYMILTDRELLIYEVASGTMVHSITLPGRIHVIRSVVDPRDPAKEYILCGAENKRLYIYNADTYDLITSPQLHENRLRAVDTVKVSHPTDSTASEALITTASSDGKIRVWSLHGLLEAQTDASQPPSPLGEYDTGCRLTCMTAS